MPVAFAMSTKKLGIALARVGVDGSPSEFRHPDADDWGPWHDSFVMPMRPGQPPNEAMQAGVYDLPDDSECVVALYELVDGQPPKLLRLAPAESPASGDTYNFCTINRTGAS